MSIEKLIISDIVSKTVISIPPILLPLRFVKARLSYTVQLKYLRKFLKILAYLLNKLLFLLILTIII
jgi:hypothetical protein